MPDENTHFQKTKTAYKDAVLFFKQPGDHDKITLGP